MFFLKIIYIPRFMIEFKKISEKWRRVWFHRDNNYLLENLISNSKVAIFNNIFNSFLGDLKSNRAYLQDLHQLAMLQLLADILFWAQLLKEKSITEFNALNNSSCSVLVYTVKKSLIEPVLAAFRLLIYSKYKFLVRYFESPKIS